MVDFTMLLDALSEIQGASDPNHPASSLTERMGEIFGRASRMLDRAGYEPENTHPHGEDCDCESGDDAEPTEPEEGDYVLSDTGPLGSQTSLGIANGKHLRTFTGDNQREQAEAFIRERMESEQFYPNVWTCSDHGNYCLITLTDKPH